MFQSTTFITILSGKSTGPTGIEVPQNHIEDLCNGKKPAVWVEANVYRYQSTVGVMGGKFMIPFSSEHRKASGIKAGDKICVILTLDETLRIAEIPVDLNKALKENDLLNTFERLAPSAKKEYISSVNEAKTKETMVRRIQKIMEKLKLL